MLNEMRFGRLSKASIAKFQSLSRPVVYDDGIVPTELYVQQTILVPLTHSLIVFPAARMLIVQTKHVCKLFKE